jgi:hypothetical protein
MAQPKKPFRIWLKNLAPGTQYYWGEGTMYHVGTILEGYFTQICAKTAQFSIASYSWEPAAGLIEDHELLVYFLASASGHHSIVATKTNQPLGQSGSTFPTATGVISEVYLDAPQGDPDYGRLVANLVFHELMHNKLDAYTSGGVLQDIHVQGGGGLAVGTPITSGDRPNAKNISLMAQVLGKNHPQYTTDVSRVSPYP